MLPEFELRQTANERLEFIRTLGRERRAIHNFQLRIDLGRQKPNQEIQEIDPQPIGDYVKTLKVIHTQTIDRRNTKRSQPSPNRMRRRSVQIVLKRPRELAPPFREWRAAVLSRSSLH